MILLRLLNMRARINAPDAVKIQPRTLMLPNLARVAGKTKIPEPIILPTTSEVAVINPILADLVLTEIAWLPLVLTLNP